MKQVLKISVRNLVEFIMRRGSIDDRYIGASKALEGIKGHQVVQKLYKEKDQAEVSIKHKFSIDNYEINIEGRIDGLLFEDEKVIIDEIKTTTRDLLFIDENTNPLHFAQAKCYGYIYCIQNYIDIIDIQLTYYNIDTKATRILRHTYSLKELEIFFYELLNKYIDWLNLQNEWTIVRDLSIKNLKFPFENYRPGQREFAIRVYKSIEYERKCFAQAPTGTGKTISTLFPAIKAMGEQKTSKIFYLTAKTITREVAESSIELMRKSDLKLKSITIHAKEKVCKMNKISCNPENCIYADGYFDRINEALKKSILKYDSFDSKTIDLISEEYKLCPFELVLDLIYICDVVICDYNYVFDPRVNLKRFFDTKKTDFTFLIDEAHNLVDRARDMYSANISSKTINKVKDRNIKDKNLNYAIKQIEEYMNEEISLLDTFSEKHMVKDEKPSQIYKYLNSFLNESDKYLSKVKEENQELMDLYFEIHRFINILELYDENYVTLYTREFEGINIKLYCVNPSKEINNKIEKSKSTTIFSATLIPMDYYMDMYGYTKDDFIINLKSPFNINNRLLMIGNNIDTTYNKREESSEDIARYIYEVYNSKKGNYMAFFPSYQYMRLIYEKLKKLISTEEIIVQENEMSELNKKEFLLKFEDNTNPNIGLCVLGGHFSEGIDLIEDKLIGVVIVGVGMPQIGIDRDIIKDNMNEENKGFEYAYIYPGIIKVLQAAGRCIRTDNDKGIILLLDRRYSEQRYKKLFPYEWNDRNIVRNIDEVKHHSQKFWDRDI